MKSKENNRSTVLLKIIKRSMVVLCLLIVVQMILVVTLPAFAAGSGEVVLVTSTSPKVYSGAGTGYSSLGITHGGTEHEFLSQAKGTDGVQWYEIRYSDSKTGWISSKSSVKLSAEERKDPQNGVKAIAEAFGAVGVQAATIEKGVVTDSYYSGWAIKNSRAMAADTKIRAASLSKVAIAMTAMKMQEEGIVNIDAQIGAYWGATLPKAITLRHLLTHTSTLKSLTAGSGASGVLSQLKSSSSYTTGTPGSSSVWYYNNYGAAVAGSTLEMAANQTIDSYADSRIFNSLGIDAAWMSGRVDTSKLATLYRSDGTVGRSADTSATLVGSDTPGANTAYYAGGFTTSAAEYAKLVAILANDGTYGGTRYLTAESVAQMEKLHFTCDSGKATAFEQGLALRHMDGLYGQSELYYHTGNAYGMLSLASYNPSTRNGVVVFTTGCTMGTDSQGIYAVCSAISRYLYNVIENRPGKPATAVEIDKTEIKLREGEIMFLAATLTPADSDSEIEWTSSNSACASVTDDGAVTAIAPGTATITAAAGDVSATCTVTVITEEVGCSVTPAIKGAASKLYEPWGLKYFASYDGDDVDKITERGVVMLKDEFYTDGMTPEAFRTNKNAYDFSSARNELGFEAPSAKYPNGRYTALLDEGIYSYDIGAAYYALPYAVMENGQIVYGTIRNISMEQVLNSNLSSSAVSAEEKTICSCVLALKESVATYYSATGIQGASIDIHAPRGSSQITASKVMTPAESGITPSVKGAASRLIEPWGLKFTAAYTADSRIADRGIVMLREDSYSDAYASNQDAMRLNAEAYVFTEGDETLQYVASSDRYSALLTEGISSRDISAAYYAAPFVVLNDGSYVYGTVRSISMLNILNTNLSSSAVSAEEKAVCQDIIDLYEAVKAFYEAE